MDMDKCTPKELVSLVYNFLQVNMKRMSICLEKSGKLHESTLYKMIKIINKHF